LDSKTKGKKTGILSNYLLRNNLSKHSNSNQDASSQGIIFKITNDDYGNEEETGG
jgi:hypothetical protein